MFHGHFDHPHLPKSSSPTRVRPVVSSREGYSKIHTLRRPQFKQVRKGAGPPNYSRNTARKKQQQHKHKTQTPERIGPPKTSICWGDLRLGPKRFEPSASIFERVLAPPRQGVHAAEERHEVPRQVVAQSLARRRGERGEVGPWAHRHRVDG